MNSENKEASILKRLMWSNLVLGLWLMVSPFVLAILNLRVFRGSLGRLDTWFWDRYLLPLSPLIAPRRTNRNCGLADYGPRLYHPDQSLFVQLLQHESGRVE